MPVTDSQRSIAGRYSFQLRSKWNGKFEILRVPPGVHPREPRPSLATGVGSRSGNDENSISLVGRANIRSSYAVPP